MSIHFNNDSVAPFSGCPRPWRLGLHRQIWLGHYGPHILPGESDHQCNDKQMQGILERDMCFERTRNVIMYVRQGLDTEVRDELEEG